MELSKNSVQKKEALLFGHMLLYGIVLGMSSIFAFGEHSVSARFTIHRSTWTSSPSQHVDLAPSERFFRSCVTACRRQ